MAGNIRTYDAPDNGLQTNSGVSNAFENLARTQIASMRDAGSAIEGGIRAVGRSAQTYVDTVIAREEISTGAAALAVKNNNRTTEWNKIANDPATLNDPTIGAKFVEGLEPDFEEFLGAFNTEKGRAWAEGQVANMRQHWYERTAADVATRAGYAVQRNFDILVNNAANTVAMDPSQLNIQLGMMGDTVDGLLSSSPDIDPSIAAQLKTTLLQNAREKVVASALEAQMIANPTAFLSDLQKGVFDNLIGDMPPGVRTNIENAAKVQIKAQETEAKATEVQVTKEQQAAIDKARTSSLLAALNGDPNQLTTSINEMAKMPGLKPEDLTAHVNALQKIYDDKAAGKNVSDRPEVVTDFRQRAVLPVGNPKRLTPTEINQAIIAGTISEKSAKHVSALLNSEDEGYRNDQTYLQKTLDDYKKAFEQNTSSIFAGQTTSGLTMTADAERRYGLFQQDMQAAFDYGRAQGISARDLLDPRSKDFILGPNAALLAQYVSMSMEDFSKPFIPTFATSTEGLETFNSATAGFFDTAPVDLTGLTVEQQAAKILGQ